MNEEHIIAIEEKIAFNHNMLQELSDVIYRQQKEIDQLETTCQNLTERVRALSEVGISGTLEDERPPHY